MAQYSSVKIRPVSDIVRTAAYKTIYVGKGMQDKQTNRPRLARVLNHKQTSKTSARQTRKLFGSRLLPPPIRALSLLYQAFNAELRPGMQPEGLHRALHLPPQIQERLL